jgi:hypothetical protein
MMRNFVLANLFVERLSQCRTRGYVPILVCHEGWFGCCRLALGLHARATAGVCKLLFRRRLPPGYLCRCVVELALKSLAPFFS